MRLALQCLIQLVCCLHPLVHAVFFSKRLFNLGVVLQTLVRWLVRRAFKQVFKLMKQGRTVVALFGALRLLAVVLVVPLLLLVLIFKLLQVALHLALLFASCPQLGGIALIQVNVVLVDAETVAGAVALPHQSLH